MNASLTPELSSFVAGQVKGRLYSTASEVVREWLRMPAGREKLRELRREEFRKRVQAGLDQLDRGHGLDSEGVFDDLEQEIEDLEKRQGMT